MRVRVVWGRGDTIATCSPRIRLSRVDLPTLGLPTMATKPARRDVSFLDMEMIAPPQLSPPGIGDGRRGRAPWFLGAAWSSGLLAAADDHLLELHLGVAGQGDLGHQLLPLHHLAEDGVAAVEVRRRHLGEGAGAGDQDRP